MRMTFDFQDNEVKQMNGQADICVNIAKEMGAKKIDRSISPVPYSIVPYQSTHNTGGAVFGADPNDQRSEQVSCRSGTCRTYSSPAPACSPRTPARTRPARWARSPTGRWTRSRTGI